MLTNTNEISSVYNLQIFPNPVNELLRISVNELTIDEIIIRNLNGQILIREANNSSELELDVQLLQKGMYLIEIKADEKITTKKFVKV